jgi:hypothetical protein
MFHATSIAVWRCMPRSTATLSGRGAPRSSRQYTRDPSRPATLLAFFVLAFFGDFESTRVPQRSPPPTARACTSQDARERAFAARKWWGGVGGGGREAMHNASGPHPRLNVRGAHSTRADSAPRIRFDAEVAKSRLPCQLQLSDIGHSPFKRPHGKLTAASCTP